MSAALQQLINGATTPTATDTPLPTSTPAEPAAGATKIIEGVTFVYVPAGEFTMGSDNGYENEKPSHKVSLAGFWIMQTEVTNGQYKRCVDAGECQRQGMTGGINLKPATIQLVI